MLIIGEKLNGFIPGVGNAVKTHDAAYIKELAAAQAQAGADYLDVCARSITKSRWKRSNG